MADSFWNDDNTALTIALWEGGQSASKIADRIGAATKNMVIGKINRLRNAGHAFARQAATAGTEERRRISRAGGQARAAAAKARPKAPRKPNNNLLAFNLARRAEIEAGKTVKSPKPPAAVEDATFAKPWTERRFGECAFPILGEGADTISCCAGTQGKTYCKAHAARMFHKPADTGKRFVNGVARSAA
jgi:hypothetical protein